MSARAVRRLAVVLYGVLAGHVDRTNGSLSFAYEPDYLARSNATPLSLSMPLSSDRYTNRPVTSYLKGLLPDNEDVRRVGLARDQVRGWVKEMADAIPDALSDELAALRAAASRDPEADMLLPRVRRIAELTVKDLNASTPRRKRIAGSRLLAEVTAEA